ncbi:MAG: thioredoxin family protein [Salinimicrobium sp.]
MKILISLLFLVSALNCGNPDENTENPDPATSISEVNEQQDILVGEITKEDLTQAPYSSWFDPMFKSYEPSEEVLEKVKNNINDYKIMVFMGTWCGDSKAEVPKLYKLLEESGYDMDNIEMQAVRHDKTLPDDLQEEYNVHHVPTIIFYKDGKEVNRFVEYPQEDFGKDIAKIVSGQEYHNSYE